MLHGLVEKRAVSERGLYLWGVRPKDGSDLVWIDGDQLHTFIRRAQQMAKVQPPRRKLPTLKAVSGLAPREEEGWDYTAGELVGRAATVLLAAGTGPTTRGAPAVDPAAQRRSRTKAEFTVVIEAALRKGQDSPTSYWGRVQSEPSLSVVFVSTQEAADGVYAHDSLRHTNLRARQRRFPRLARAGEPSLDSLVSEVGDFADFSGRSPAWAESLQVFGELTSGDPVEAMGLGFVLDQRKVPSMAQPVLRRALARVVELVEEDHPLGFRLFEYFSGMVQAPTEEEDFGGVVKRRVALLLAGKWEELLAGVVRRTPGHRSSPTVEGDHLDTKASRVQYHITKNGSLSKAAQTLRSPLNPPTPEPGVFTATMKKLHPQVGDPLPPPPFEGGQGGGDRPPALWVLGYK